MGQVRIDPGRRAVAFALVVLTAVLTLAGTSESPVAAAVTAVKGGAEGYRLQVSLFGGPVNTRGVGQQTCSAANTPPGCVPADQAAEASSPSVVLPSDGGRLNASKPEGAAARSGPATFFSSGQLDVATSGETGPGGSVTSSTRILNINREGSEVFTAVAAASTCSASETGLSASTTITGGTLMTDSGDDALGTAHDPVVVTIPTNPEPNTTYTGHIHVNGTTDSWRYVFNEQVVNLDGSITVYAAHQYLLGPTAVGDLYIGKADCGVTGDGTASTTTTTSGVPTTPPTVSTTLPVPTTLPPTPSTTVPSANLAQFCNPAPIQQPNPFSFVSGAATPYPSPIVVTGLTGTVTDVEVTLVGFTTRGEPWPEDNDILVAAPNNATVILMSDAGGDNWEYNEDTTAANLIFDDEAAEQLPADGHITDGRWRSVDDDEDHAGDAGNPDVWPAPAPPLVDTTLLSSLDGIDPNGTWNLFANDDQVLGTSDILGGWCVNITTTFTGPTTTTTVPPSTTTTVPPTTTTTTTVPPPADHPIADFDGDGDSDVSVFRPVSGTWYLQGRAQQNYGASGDVAVPADYDGDGRSDVAVFRPSNGVWYLKGSAGSDRAVAFGASGDVPVPGDYDGDAKADIAVFRPANGVWFLQGSAGTDTAVAFGAGGDIPVPADYDGDGKTDIAVFRGGVWYVHRSGGTDTAVAFGTSGDVPVPGDYDGNGTAEVAVFRPSAGVWFVQGGAATAWGTSGDIPVPGDYDGDGDLEIAVFRPSNGVWFVQGGATTAWGTNGDVPLPLPAAVYRSMG